MKKIIIAQFFCLILLIGCKEKEKNGVEIKKTYYPNGSVKSEERYTSDSNGVYVANGFYKEYYENGALEHIVFHKNGVQDSLSLSYYPNGVLSDSLYLWHGRMMGFQYAFYENGKPKAESYQTSNTSALFKIAYNEKGEIDSLLGSLIDVNLRVDTLNQIVLNEPSSILIKVVILKNVTTTLNILVKDHENNVIKDTSMNRFKNRLNTFAYLYNAPFTKSGLYKYDIKAIATDNSTGHIIKTDSSEYILNVIK
jgi:antitoxin component YwqK of YwqJK toxin-antitoxin module